MTHVKTLDTNETEANDEYGYMHRLQFKSGSIPAGAIVGDQIVTWSQNTLESGCTVT